MNSNLTMREVPPSERPYEKCIQYGPAVLSDSELLAVILRCGTGGENVSSLALRLRRKLEEHGGLSALGQMSPDELMECRGIGKVKAVQLLCTAELARRIHREGRHNAMTMNCPASVAEFFMEEMCFLSKEHTVAAFFDTRGHLLHWLTVSVGTVNASLLSPREVFLEALKYRAVHVILLHNHPSGDPSPSEEDLSMTERMVAAGQILSIPLLDHIIIGDHCYLSLKEQGFIPDMEN